MGSASGGGSDAARVEEVSEGAGGGRGVTGFLKAGRGEPEAVEEAVPIGVEVLTRRAKPKFVTVTLRPFFLKESNVC